MMKSKKKKSIIIGLILVLGVFGYWCLSRQPVFLPLLSTEAQTYHIQSDDKYPKFTNAVIDPLDVKVGDAQKMIVKLEDSSGIDWVKAEIEHDAGIDKINLKLTEEKNTYFGIWEVHSTHSKTYYTTFIAQNKEGKQNSITLAWSDPCSPPNGGDWTLDGNCMVSEVNGVDNGNFIVAGGYTLTIQNGATFAWNDGKSITITNGSIVINSGGQLKKTDLWMTDADGDTYAPSGASQSAQDSAPGNAARRNTIVQGKYDCDDGDASIYPGQVCREASGICKVADICQDDGSCPDNYVADGTDCGTCVKCSAGSCSGYYDKGTKDTTDPGQCTAIHYRCNGLGNCTAPTQNVSVCWETDQLNCNEICSLAGTLGCVKGIHCYIAARGGCVGSNTTCITPDPCAWSKCNICGSFKYSGCTCWDWRYDQSNVVDSIFGVDKNGVKSILWVSIA